MIVLQLNERVLAGLIGLQLILERKDTIKIQKKSGFYAVYRNIKSFILNRQEVYLIPCFNTINQTNNMILTAIVIDDSPMQRLTTTKLVESNPNLKLLGNFDKPEVGLQTANLFRPDVVFLDVEMPGLNGFEVLESLEYDCQVILNSTRSQFALNAFQYDYVKDYVTKPMKKDRFKKSVERVVKNQIAKQKTAKQPTVPVYHERLRKAS